MSPKAIDFCRETFGTANPEDVIEPIALAADVLEWLSEVFEIIGSEPGASCRAQRLAAMGSHLALDAANAAQYSHERMKAAVTSAR